MKAQELMNQTPEQLREQLVELRRSLTTAGLPVPSDDEEEDEEEEITAATGWQSHTVRGAMAGALKKKLGLDATSEKVENRGRVYKLPAA